MSNDERWISKMGTNFEDDNTTNEDELINAAMNIILHAGDARVLADKAFQYAKDKNFELARETLKKAEEELTKAHQSQTKIIQDEARGISHEPSLLFNHAQDHLMTIMVEIRLTKKMLSLMELF